MKELTIKLSGTIQHSNFDDWKLDLEQQIQSATTALDNNDDLVQVSEYVGKFRAAEQTLREAKLAAIEQAADINRLFDAVDSIAEETRQARLNIERRIRTQKLEIQQHKLREGMDNNAQTLDALGNSEQLLFQDRASLLTMAPEELQNTIDQRLEMWREHTGDNAFPGNLSHTDEDYRIGEIVTDVESERATESADDGRRSWRISLKLLTGKSNASSILYKIKKQWKNNSAVESIEMQEAVSNKETRDDVLEAELAD